MRLRTLQNSINRCKTFLRTRRALLENSDLFPEGLGLDKVSLTSPATVAAAVTIIRDAVDEAQGRSDNDYQRFKRHTGRAGLH